MTDCRFRKPVGVPSGPIVIGAASEEGGGAKPTCDTRPPRIPTLRDEAVKSSVALRIRIDFLRLGGDTPSNDEWLIGSDEKGFDDTFPTHSSIGGGGGVSVFPDRSVLAGDSGGGLSSKGTNLATRSEDSWRISSSILKSLIV
jgi:hypothetical protein